MKFGPWFGILSLAVSLESQAAPWWCKRLSRRVVPTANDNFYEISYPDSVPVYSAKTQSPAYVNLVQPRPAPYKYSEDVASSGNYAFLVAGTNSNEVIRYSKTLTGVPWKILTRRSADPVSRGTYRSDGKADFPAEMQSEISKRLSHAGHLRTGERMQDRLMLDNELVLRQGLTHQEIAAPVLDVLHFVEEWRRELFARSRPRHVIFVRDGLRFALTPNRMDSAIFTLPELLVAGWRRAERGDTQGSIFNDFLFTNYEVFVAPERLYNPDNPRLGLRIDAVSAGQIFRYGFYQSSDYRIDPQRVIDMFHLR